MFFVFSILVGGSAKIGFFVSKPSSIFIEHKYIVDLVELSGIGQADHSAHRMANDRDFLKPLGLHQASQVVDVVGLAVAAAGRPIGIAVPAKVRGDDMKPRPQRPRQLIPAAGNDRDCRESGAAAAPTGYPNP